MYISYTDTENIIDFSEKEKKPKEEADESGISYLGSWRHGHDYFRMDGSTQPEQRKKWCNYFNKVRFLIPIVQYKKFIILI